MAFATRFASMARATLTRRSVTPSFSAPSILRSSSPSSALSAIGLLHPNIFASGSPATTIGSAIRCFTVPAAFRNESKRGPNTRRPGRRAAKLLSKIKAKRRRIRRKLPSM
ncbi:hypothetical protein P389DRAFT_208579 [Cystobasidium minutum MCA 4210]|uniref:uncharacterized protein n=1 Tax=Cystobasidium minutum MCA 4210 TaxID=1397322 RepID=UPI0034CE99C3|eukprot:jgi/Rhomi1/208579/estExt_Genemark1.C_2_t10277